MRIGVQVCRDLFGVSRLRVDRAVANDGLERGRQNDGDPLRHRQSDDLFGKCGHGGEGKRCEKIEIGEKSLWTHFAAVDDLEILRPDVVERIRRCRRIHQPYGRIAPGVGDEARDSRRDLLRPPTSARPIPPTPAAGAAAGPCRDLRRLRRTVAEIGSRRIVSIRDNAA